MGDCFGLLGFLGNCISNGGTWACEEEESCTPCSLSVADSAQEAQGRAWLAIPRPPMHPVGNSKYHQARTILTLNRGSLGGPGSA